MIPLLSQPEKRNGKLQLQTVQFAGIRSRQRVNFPKADGAYDVIIGALEAGLASV